MNTKKFILWLLLVALLLAACGGGPPDINKLISEDVLQMDVASITISEANSLEESPCNDIDENWTEIKTAPAIHFAGSDVVFRDDNSIEFVVTPSYLNKVVSVNLGNGLKNYHWLSLGLVLKETTPPYMPQDYAYAIGIANCNQKYYFVSMDLRQPNTDA